MDDTVTWFGLAIGNELGLCVALMRDTGFEVLFNQRPLGKLTVDDNLEWVLTTGDSLPNEIVYEMARKIQLRYW